MICKPKILIFIIVYRGFPQKKSCCGCSGGMEGTSALQPQHHLWSQNARDSCGSIHFERNLERSLWGFQKAAFVIRADPIEQALFGEKTSDFVIKLAFQARICTITCMREAEYICTLLPPPPSLGPCSSLKRPENINLFSFILTLVPNLCEGFYDFIGLLLPSASASVLFIVAHPPSLIPFCI